MMSKKYVYYACILVIILFYSCKKRESFNGFPILSDHKTLNVSLKETRTSFHNLFDRMELIPLETASESLIKKIDKIDCMNDQYYIFDNHQSSVIVFDEKGDYRNKISKIGQGPGEYTYIYDFYLGAFQIVARAKNPQD